MDKVKGNLTAGVEESSREMGRQEAADLYYGTLSTLQRHSVPDQDRLPSTYCRRITLIKSYRMPSVHCATPNLDMLSRPGQGQPRQLHNYSKHDDGARPTEEQPTTNRAYRSPSAPHSVIYKI